MESYRWSSYAWIQTGDFTLEDGLDLRKLQEEYGDPPQLSALKGWCRELDGG